MAHLGDGLAGIVHAADWPAALLSQPQNGEFANETFFVTEDDWRAHLRFMEAPGLRVGGVVALLTDGAMPFVIGQDQVGLRSRLHGAGLAVPGNGADLCVGR